MSIDLVQNYSFKFLLAFSSLSNEFQTFLAVFWIKATLLVEQCFYVCTNVRQSFHQHFLVFIPLFGLY